MMAKASSGDKKREHIKKTPVKSLRKDVKKPGRNMTIALVGNPNCGKTTFFNTLTGSNQHVGNWQGKTVEEKSGTTSINGSKITVVDLPGTYSLSAYSAEEIVTRDYIARGEDDFIIDIVDSTNLQRNLYLALELLELGQNMIIALNMHDMAKEDGMSIDTKKMSELLGVPVVICDARSRKDVENLVISAMDRSIWKGCACEKKRFSYGSEIEEHIAQLENMMIGKGIGVSYAPPRWIAIKLLENDEDVLEKVRRSKGSENILSELSAIKTHLKGILGKNHETIVSDRRHGLVSGVVKESVRRTSAIKEPVSDKIDRIVLNKYIAIPIFLAILFLVFQFTFTLSAPFSSIIAGIINSIGSAISSALADSNAPHWLPTLITDGIIGGVGSVIVFLPTIFVLFFLISILEDSGYLARVAYIMDSLMHKIGLHGKSFIPLILGFGCNVPGIMAARALDNKRDRTLTILMSPFMLCSARLPIFVLFVGAFFTKNQGLILFSLYLLGIIVAILTALLFNRIFFKGISSELIMELPAYRVPTLKGAVIHMWEKGKSFLQKATTYILAFTIAIWFLSSFPLGVEYASEDSLIGHLGKFLAPLFEPLGFGNWQTSIALLFGIAAKEVVIGSYATLYGVGESSLTGILQGIFTPLSAISFMVLVLLYFPCVATIAVMKKETGSWKWTGLSIAYGLAVGWILAFITYHGGLLLGFR